MYDSLYVKFLEKANCTVRKQISTCLELRIGLGTDYKWTRENSLGDGNILKLVHEVGDVAQ